MPNNVLLSIDLSDPESSQHALQGALGLLSDAGTLHVVSVLPSFGLSQVSGYFTKDFEKQALRHFGQALEQWVQTNVPKTIKSRPHVLHGTVYHEVLMAADKLQVDVIVLSAHRPAFKDYFLGPNAARIVRHAKQSVYVVRN
jgi:nucleotide-binding universal stress UspA family protein